MLRQSFALAVRHEVLVRDPIDHVSRLHKPERTPTALTATEVNAIRAVIRAWELTRGASGPNPDGQLGQIVEVHLGTSARIGEVLAIRRRDLNLTTTPATLGICGTVISERGGGTYRQEGLVKAGMTLWLLQSQSLETFILVKSVSVLGINVVSASATIALAALVARQEGLMGSTRLVPIPVRS